MGQAQRVSQFMHGLDQQPVGENVRICWQPVEFLPQTMIGNQRSGAAQLGFPKNESQNWDVEVQFRDSDQAPGAAVDVPLHPGQNFGGVVLLAFRVARKRGIDGWPQDLGGHTKFLVELMLQPFEQPSVHWYRCQKLYFLHVGPREQPAISSCLINRSGLYQGTALVVPN